MKHFFTFFLCLFCFSQLSAQIQLNVKIQPQNILLRNSLLPLSMELRSHHLGIEYEHGFQMPNVFLGRADNNILLQNRQYNRFRMGLRYYFSNAANQSQSTQLLPFVGVYGSYMPLNYEKQDSWYQKENGNAFYYEQASVSVKYWKSYLCAGVQIYLSDAFFIDYLVGLGIKTRNIRYETFNETLDILGLAWDEWLTPIDRKEGFKTFLFPALNFRLAYQLFSVEKEIKTKEM